LKRLTVINWRYHSRIWLVLWHPICLLRVKSPHREIRLGAHGSIDRFGRCDLSDLPALVLQGDLLFDVLIVVLVVPLKLPMTWPFIFIYLMKVLLSCQISLPRNVLLGLIEINSLNIGLLLLGGVIQNGWGKRCRWWIELIIALNCIASIAFSVFGRFLIGRISVHKGRLTWPLLHHQLRMISLYREACRRINHFLSVVLNDKDVRLLSSRSLNHVSNFYTLWSSKVFPSIVRTSFNYPTHCLGGIVADSGLTFPSSLVEVSEGAIRALHLKCGGSNLHLL